MKKIAAISFIALFTTQAYAGFSEISYTDFAISKDRHLSLIAQSFDLSSNEEYAAKKASASYVFLTSCLGSVSGEKSEDLSKSAIPSISIANNLNPKNKFTAAVASMVAHHITTNFGRIPLENTCKFVAETAFENVSPKTVIGYCFHDGKPYADQIKLTCINKQ